MWCSQDVLDIITRFKLQQGTSFYAYNLSTCIRKVEYIKENFKNWYLLYSMKANPNPVILKNILECNVGIDAASKQEVLLARQLGCPQENIFYSAPGKTKNDLQRCYNQCILIADSVNEVKRIIEISNEVGEQINIGLRVNIPNSKICGNALEVMGGISSKFGISSQDVRSIINVCQKNNVKIIGIHVYFGSQILDENILINNFIKIADYALNLCKDIKLDFVTFGGGFGIPYINSEKHLKISDITNNETLQEKIHLLRSRNIKCNLELGRYLVAESGVFCATVEDIKISSEKKYVILSAGMNAFIRPIFTKEFHKLNNCRKSHDKLEKVTIVGNLCTPIDQYYEDYIIDNPEIGDWLWFENAGAYGYSMSMLNFISREKPLEIIV